MNEQPSIVTIVDTEFENSPSRINLLKEFPETRIGDRVLGPYRQGQEVELPLWIASHFVQMGYARFRDEDEVTLSTLSTMHYRQNLSGVRQIPHISKPFYFKLRRLLKELKEKEKKDRAIGRDFDKAVSLARDIANNRAKKIAALAASGEQTSDLTSNLTREEQDLYDKLRSVLDPWKRDVVGVEDSK